MLEWDARGYDLRATCSAQLKTAPDGRHMADLKAERRRPAVKVILR